MSSVMDIVTSFLLEGKTGDWVKHIMMAGFHWLGQTLSRPFPWEWKGGWWWLKQVIDFG